MKKAGIIILILGCLAFIGALLRGLRITGPAFWIGLGIFLIVRAQQKKQDKEEEDNWNNQK